MERVVGPIDGAASSGREVVIRALDNCYDPCCRDRKISVVDMGLTESIEVRDGEVSVRSPPGSRAWIWKRLGRGWQKPSEGEGMGARCAAGFPSEGYWIRSPTFIVPRSTSSTR